ncbi:hypothetical protein [Paenibacillus thermotolerans]|uniref:hypothetical protein n=1 Tax=Paenibacillus thermotolerans TaxID=3027807 RepID=UPI00236824F0|nr:MULTISPECIES: hypothetical protein [unclassified Paenibacillus]
MSSIPTAAEKVIYQYTLVKKVRRKPVWSYFYILVLLAYGTAAAVMDSYSVWLALAASVIGYIMIEYAVTRTVSWARPEWEASLSRFQWVSRFPWFGYLPAQSVTFRSYRLAQSQAFLAGCIAAGIASAWLTQYESAPVAAGLLWVTFPRLWLLFAVRKAAKSTYLIRFDDKEVSIYAS